MKDSIKVLYMENQKLVHPPEIILQFEVKRGEPVGKYYFSVRMKLTEESKSLLREKLGNSVLFDKLDSYVDLDHIRIFIFCIINTAIETNYM